MFRQVLLAALGATGFAILFGMEKKNLWMISLASGFAWYGYLLLCKCLDESFAIFCITAFVVLLSGILSFFVKCPLFLFSTPILIPFIPGAPLYYVMYDIVSKNMALYEDLKVLIYQVGAMALGILVAEFGIRFIRKCLSICTRQSLSN